jgi:hypothetical protein
MIYDDADYLNVMLRMLIKLIWFDDDNYLVKMIMMFVRS